MFEKTVKHASFYAIIKLLSRILSFIAIFLVARRIGPANFGVYTYILSIIFILYPLANLGMLSEAIRRSKSKTTKHLENYFSTYLISILFFSLIVFIILRFRGYSLILSLFSLLLFVSLSLFYYLINITILTNKNNLLYIAIFLERFIFSIFALLLPFKALSLILAFLLSTSISSILLIFFNRFKPNFVFKLNFEFFSFWFFLDSVLRAISTRIGAILYDLKYGVKSLGNFGIADYINQALSNLILDMTNFITIKSGDFNKEHYKKSMEFSIILGSTLFLLILFLNPLLFKFSKYLFGNNYDKSPLIFSILLFILPVRLFQIFPISYFYYKDPKIIVFSRTILLFFNILGVILGSNIVIAVLIRVIGEYLSTIFYYASYLVYK